MAVDLMMVGDVFPANVKYNEGNGVASRFFSHLGKPWERKLAPFFQEADIVFANLEAPLVEDSGYAATHTFAGCKEFAGFLSNIGVNIVSIANNHILEQQSEGFYSTLKYLEDSLVSWVGQQVQGASNIKVLQRRGVRVGFAAFNGIQNLANPGLVADLREEDIVDSVGKMKAAQVDVCVISLHWGDEYVNVPSMYQMDLGHRLIDAGADIIVGHHPHVVQPVESYKNGLIFYSLGNFLFDILWTRNVRTGAIARVRLSGTGIESYELMPVFLEKDYAPVRLNGSRLGTFQRRLQRNSRNMSAAGDKYEAYYKRTQRLNRLWHRIAMKWSLFRNWRRLGRGVWRQLGMNVKGKLVKHHDR